MEKLLTVQNLTYRYDPRKPDGILDLNFELYRGEILALLGPSGAGKTTTLNLLKGSLSPQKGEILWHEKEITAGMIKQSFEEDKSLTVLKFLEDSLEHVSDSDKRMNQIRSVLSQLDITNEIDSPLDQISGGQLQRVLIAKELANNPEVIFFDEPFANLDLNLKTDLLDEIIPLIKQRNITVIWTTHHFEEVLPFADKLMLINTGELQAFGNPKEVFYHPKNIFSALYFGKNNILPVKVLDTKKISLLGQVFELENCQSDLITIRPGDIKIVPDSPLKANVKGAYFHGPYSFLQTEVNSQELWVQHNGQSEIPTDISLEITCINPLD